MVAAAWRAESLVTNRLVLRWPEDADKPSIVSAVNDPEVTRFLTRVPYPYSERDADDWIRSCAEARANDGPIELIIEERESGAVAGSVGLREASSPRYLTLGYWIRRDAWGRGYATEAARSMVRLAFGPLKADTVAATTAVDNLASQAVLKHCGFRYEGRSTETFHVRGVTLPVALYRRDRPGLRAGAVLA